MPSIRCSLPYQPSGNKPAPDGDPAYADQNRPTTLPPQTETTIGDLLNAKGVTWAWYAGAWGAALDGAAITPNPKFQYPSPAVQLFRQSCARRSRARPNICAMAESMGRNSSKRSTPGLCRRSAFTSRRAALMNILATPTCYLATSTSPISWRISKRARNGDICSL